MNAVTELTQEQQAHWDWINVIEKAVRDAVENYQPVAIVGSPGTGRTCLAWGALPQGLHIKLAMHDSARLQSIPYDLEHGASHVIFDDVSTIKPGSPGAEAILDQCKAMRGFIAIFDSEADIENYMAANVSVEVFNLDSHARRTIP